MEDAGFPVRLLVTALATWRLTHLLALEDGPGEIVLHLRRAMGSGRLGDLFDCFNCLSLWTAAPAALFVARTPADWLLCWLGLSGAACLLQRLEREPVFIEAADAQPAKGVSDVLRTETSSIPSTPGDARPYPRQYASQTGEHDQRALP